MATRKVRKSRKPIHNNRKTVRGHKRSTAGKILPPLDVRSNKHLKEFEKRIKNGDLTIILVWAQWCPHCHTMMPHFDAAAKSLNRSIQAVKVEESMLPAVNQSLTSNINKSAKPLNVEGYPSIIVVDKNGNKVTDIEPVRNTATMTKVMEKAGPLANQAKLSNSIVSSNNSENLAALTASLPSMNTNKNKNVNKNTIKNKNLLKDVGIEEEGLATTTSPKNFDMGEEELKGSMVTVNSNKNIELKSISTNKSNNSNVKNNNKNNNRKNNSSKELEVSEESIAPSPLNTFPGVKNEPTAPPSNNKQLVDEAETITSLASPLTPPSIGNDIEEVLNSEPKSISNKLTPEQKVGGGRGSRGGSLFSAMARTTYTLAPAAALLATAAMVIKQKPRKSRKHSKKSRKVTHRRR